ncbi:MAG: hypothetical protein QXG05_05150 [Nitrososphaerota archaeon]
MTEEDGNETVKLTITLSKKLYNAIRFLADCDNTSIEQFVMYAIYDRTKASLESVDPAELIGT